MWIISATVQTRLQPLVMVVCYRKKHVPPKAKKPTSVNCKVRHLKLTKVSESEVMNVSQHTPSSEILTITCWGLGQMHAARDQESNNSTWALRRNSHPAKLETISREWKYKLEVWPPGQLGLEAPKFCWDSAS